MFCYYVFNNVTLWIGGIRKSIALIACSHNLSTIQHRDDNHQLYIALHEQRPNQEAINFKFTRKINIFTPSQIVEVDSTEVVTRSLA